MKAKSVYILLIYCLLGQFSNAQQKIGLVLSGGGAAGLAHVGVLKALEENNIPIDYITGTSAGALVGSLYSCGYSPEEIEAFILSEEFQKMAAGEDLSQHRFLMREEELSSSTINFSFSKDSILYNSLPTNLNSSALLDYKMMMLLGKVSASTGNDFDSLFVPFRCVASDISEKKSVAFSSGDLNAAVRASMTYPFFFKPITINDILYFDGGLYNNFPADIMYSDFNPDFIIGSNVSYNAEKPGDEDLIGQVTNMLVRHSNFSLPCEEGFMIIPETTVSSFDFNDVQKAIEDGYNSTLLQIDSLKKYIIERSNFDDLSERRKEFRKKIVPLKISSVNSTSEKQPIFFTRRSIIRKHKNEIVSKSKLESRYYRLYSAPQVEFIYPTIRLESDSTYSLNLDVKKSKEFELSVGGHVSSRPVNTGYIGLSYQTLERIMTKTKVESYFGKFYGSAKASFKIDFPAINPISTKVFYTLNRWDYFRSFSTFFEDVQPSFLIQNEMYAGVEISHPIGNNIKSSFDGRVSRLNNEYYQTEDFSNNDTTDRTYFNGYSIGWKLEYNTLNRKQFASSGHFVQAKIRFINGREHSISGSTAPNPYDIIQDHSWLSASLKFQDFIIDDNNFHLGIHGQVIYNSHPLFANYTASILAMPEFSLIPDLQTFFLPEYRSYQFGAIGLNMIFSLRKNLDLRWDAYYFQPFLQITTSNDGSQVFTEPFSGSSYAVSSSLIYHSFIGPVRLTLNYLPEQDNQFSFQFSYGYVLFNDRANR